MKKRGLNKKLEIFFVMILVILSASALGTSFLGQDITGSTIYDKGCIHRADSFRKAVTNEMKSFSISADTSTINEQQLNPCTNLMDRMMSYNLPKNKLEEKNKHGFIFKEFGNGDMSYVSYSHMGEKDEKIKEAIFCIDGRAYFENTLCEDNLS